MDAEEEDLVPLVRGSGAAERPRRLLEGDEFAEQDTRFHEASIILYEGENNIKVLRNFSLISSLPVH